MGRQLPSQRPVTQGYLQHRELLLTQGNLSGDEEIAQSVKTLLCRDGDLSVSPRTHTKVVGPRGFTQQPAWPIGEFQANERCYRKTQSG